MKYTFKDAYNSFDDVRVGECFSFVNNPQFPQTTVFMKIPTVIQETDGEEYTCNSICLVGNRLHYIGSQENVIIRDVELIINKR